MPRVPLANCSINDGVDVLNCVLLAVIDGGELRACLILHVACGLELPSSVTAAISEARVPDYAGATFAPSLLRKKTHVHLTRRIFLHALDSGMETLCLMLIGAGFPKDPNDPIFHGPSAQLCRLLPSYFILAVALGRPAVVSSLLGKGASPNACWLGLTPLLLAQCIPRRMASTRITNVLLKAGADPFQGIKRRQLLRLERMATILRMTSHPEAVPVSQGQVSKVYPLDFAAARGQEGYDNIVLLLNAMMTKGDPTRNVFGECRLCLLVQQDLDITIRLIKAGVDVEQADADGNTALHRAARRGLTDIVAVLIHAGAQLDRRNVMGLTALHEAALGGHLGTLHYLVSQSANTSCKTSAGETARQLAVRGGIPEHELDQLFRDEGHEASLIDGLDEIEELIRQVESFQLDDELLGKGAGSLARRTKRRFLIEKIIGFPKQLLSNIGAGRDGDDHHRPAM